MAPNPTTTSPTRCSPSPCGTTRRRISATFSPFISSPPPPLLVPLANRVQFEPTHLRSESLKPAPLAEACSPHVRSPPVKRSTLPSLLLRILLSLVFMILLGLLLLPEEDGVGPGSYYFCSDSRRNKSMAFHEVESRADWSMFHEYCRDRGLKYPLMVKRLACMVMSGAASSDCLDILQPAPLHKEMLPQMEEVFMLLENAFRKANIADEAMPYPNTHIIWMDSSDAKMKALRDIEEGEDLRICYIDASMDMEARQKILSEGFGFNCNCPRCLSGE